MAPLGAASAQPSVRRPGQQRQQQEQQGQQGQQATMAGTLAGPGVQQTSHIGGPQALSSSQLGMLQFIAGDVSGFLQTAVAAGMTTPDVVALSSAGGAPALRACARLAAAKLAAAGEVHAALLQLAAAGCGADAAELLQ